MVGIGGNHQISECIFQDNKAENGGAIYIAGSAETIQVIDCFFNNNTASEFGGAIFFANESIVLILHKLRSIRCHFSCFNY